MERSERMHAEQSYRCVCGETNGISSGRIVVEVVEVGGNDSCLHVALPALVLLPR